MKRYWALPERDVRDGCLKEATIWVIRWGRTAAFQAEVTVCVKHWRGQRLSKENMPVCLEGNDPGPQGGARGYRSMQGVFQRRGGERLADGITKLGTEMWAVVPRQTILKKKEVGGELDTKLWNNSNTGNNNKNGIFHLLSTLLMEDETKLWELSDRKRGTGLTGIVSSNTELKII